MIMQPPPEYSPPKQRFPRKTFKCMAGLTTALGVACIIVALGEIIYSVKQARSCEERIFDDYWVRMDDEVRGIFVMMQERRNFL